MNDASSRLPPLASGALVALLALPWLLPLSVVPDSVLYNQLAALAGWAGWLLLTRPTPAWRSAWPALAAIAVCVGFAVQGGFLLQGGSVPIMLMAAAVAAAAAGASGEAAVRPVALALWLAGVGSAFVAALQFAAPGMTGGWLIAASTTVGRAAGNLRQPNHLATALLCGMVTTVWLWQAGRIGRTVGIASIAGMVAAVALSASRTGALSLAVLFGWALVDRSLPRSARWTIGLTPLLYAFCWLLLAAAPHYYGAERLEANGDISSSRFAIWRNAVQLIAMHPWTGVGWGQFNFAWTFTPFPDRPVAFFDHTHNLPLQLAVEIGLPATTAVIGLLGWALWRARAACRAGAASRSARAALAMLAVLGLHSLLEYPLWYAYFLLPAAWALGVFLGSAPDRGVTVEPLQAERRPPSASPAVVGLLMLAGVAYAAWAHRRIESIVDPPANPPPRAQRHAEGRPSLLFGHHADYAAVTSAPRDTRLASFRRPLQQLVDTRLLIAYSEALHENGRHAEALYAAQRLREFRRPDAQVWFDRCRDDEPASPFQCERRPVALQWRDLRP